MVPKKGLEPPHPCGYMDLNHARLPIPPLRPGACRGTLRTNRKEMLHYFHRRVEPLSNTALLTPALLTHCSHSITLPNLGLPNLSCRAATLLAGRNNAKALICIPSGEAPVAGVSPGVVVFGGPGREQGRPKSAKLLGSAKGHIHVERTHRETGTRSHHQASYPGA